MLNMVSISQKMVEPLVLAANSSHVAIDADLSFNKMRGIVNHSVPVVPGAVIPSHYIPSDSNPLSDEILHKLLRLLCRIIHCSPITLDELDHPGWPAHPGVLSDQIRGWAHHTLPVHPIASLKVEAGSIDTADITDFTDAITDVVSIWRTVVDSSANQPKHIVRGVGTRPLVEREVTGEDVAVVAIAVAYALLDALPYLILL